MTTERYLQIRDPIHGTIPLSRAEITVVDHRAFQRLRLIKQLGLADLAFPGATHTRYAHGLGTMHIATRMFDALTRPFGLPAHEATRLRQTLRLAALFHDLGHAPLSHTTERFMPAIEQLDLGPWAFGDRGRRANHEDYTLAIVTCSELTAIIEAQFEDVGVTADDVATLIAGGAPTTTQARRFVVEGRDWLPVLCQCVSSELDADRMDYLLRDSYFAGVPYGRYDHEWILDNLIGVEENGALYMGLDARAAFGFEDYLLSRYHMFLSVYLNHIPIGYEAMLAQIHLQTPEEIALPAQVDDYLECDDVYLLSRLRKSKSPWARRLVRRQAYRLLWEIQEQAGEATVVSGPGSDGMVPDLEPAKDRLQAAGIDALVYSAKGRVSKYFDTSISHPPMAPVPRLFIVRSGRPVPVEHHVSLYRRYSGSLFLHRLYVEPTRIDDARTLLTP